VFPVRVPPLRERAEDVPLLFGYFTDRYAAKLGKKITSVARASIDLLAAYDWPGNVRELQNIVERAVILSDRTLEIDATWLEKAGPGFARHPFARPTAPEEKETIERALAASHGRVAGAEGAAAKLGIPRSTLESKIRTLHIDKYRFKSQ
jgi:DNA-binding NtrC family response regulator